MSKQKKATDISRQTREEVFNRDGRCCIICGNYNRIQAAHYINRSHGGKGIKQNLVTLCVECHTAFDNGDKREEYGHMIQGYLKALYPKFTDDRRIYDKYDWLPKENEDD